MKRNKTNLQPLFIAAVIALTALTALGYANDIILMHTPPLQLNAGRQTSVRLSITGDRNLIDSASLFYREIGRPTYTEIAIHRSDLVSNDISFNLPQLSSPSGGYEYYFSAAVRGRTITHPPLNPEANPLRLRTEQDTAVSRNIILLNNDTTVPVGQNLVFAVSLYSIEEEVDFGSIRVLMNGMDVTRSATISPPLVVFNRNNPPTGNFSFQIKANLKSGREIQSSVWQFNVQGKKSILAGLPLNMRGNFSFTSNVRSISESDSTQYTGSPINDAAFRMNLFARQDWFYFMSRIYLTSYETSRRQASNRYSFQLSAPSVDLHLVDYTPEYGSFMMSGQNVRGFSGRLYSGGLSLSATLGKTLRTVDGKAQPDTTFSGGTFQRNTLAVKLDLGEEQGMRLGFGFAKVKDDISSLDEQHYLQAEFTETDTILTVLSAPKDNLVLGSDIRISLMNQRFLVGAEVAASLYNSNIIDGAMSKEDLEEYLEGETVPFDPKKFENILIINKNIEPFVPGKANVAYQIYLRWFMMNNMLNVTYSEVGASFRSLGASYVQNDSSVLTISDYISLFRNRLSLDAGLNIVKDNLSEQKSTTTTNTSWYFQSLIRPAANLPYFRMGANIITSQNDVAVAVAVDSTLFKIDQEMISYNLGVGYRFDQIPFTVTSLDVSVTLSDDKDLAETKTFDVAKNSFHISLLNSLRIVPLQTRISFGNSTHKDTAGAADVTKTYATFGLRNEYTFFDGLFIPYLDFSTNTFGENKSSLTRYDLGTQILPYPQTSITTRVEMTSLADNDAPDRDYSTFGWYLNISKSF